MKRSLSNFLFPQPKSSKTNIVSKPRHGTKEFATRGLMVISLLSGRSGWPDRLCYEIARDIKENCKVPCETFPILTFQNILIIGTANDQKRAQNYIEKNWLNRLVKHPANNIHIGYGIVCKRQTRECLLEIMKKYYINSSTLMTLDGENSNN